MQCQVPILVNRGTDENEAALHVLAISMQSAITSKSPNLLRTDQLLDKESHRRQRCKCCTEKKSWRALSVVFGPWLEICAVLERVHYGRQKSCAQNLWREVKLENIVR